MSLAAERATPVLRIPPKLSTICTDQPQQRSVSRARVPAMPGTTLAISPSIVAAAGRQVPDSLKRKRPGDPIYFSPSLASYTHHVFSARRPPATSATSPLATMPRPMPPPTPGSSSDIRGKDSAQNAALATFNLPPTAYQDERDRSSSTPSNNGSDSSYRPVSPSLPSKRPTGAVIGKEDFELPPPPTRSRKIIQMKPQADLPVVTDSTVAASQQSGKPQSGKPQSGKKRQAAAPTAAGRKIARKTAHSLIERRRRSKMNGICECLNVFAPSATFADTFMQRSSVS